MSVVFMLTCDACGHTNAAEVLNDTATAADAVKALVRNEFWETVTYRYGRAEHTELRCPDCRIDPASEAAPELTYVSDPN